MAPSTARARKAARLTSHTRDHSFDDCLFLSKIDVAPRLVGVLTVAKLEEKQQVMTHVSKQSRRVVRLFPQQSTKHE